MRVFLTLRGRRVSAPVFCGPDADPPGHAPGLERVLRPATAVVYHTPQLAAAASLDNICIQLPACALTGGQHGR